MKDGIREKKGVLLDMDGTLWDATDCIAESWNLAIREHAGLSITLTAQDMQQVMGRTMDAIADTLFDGLERESRMALLEKCCDRENVYLREHGGVLYPGVEETLRKLRRDYPLYIVSNCQKGYIEAFLDHYGLRDVISGFACYGDNLLPKSANIRRVVEGQCLTKAVYVGDIQADYVASMEAGVGFIHAAYGFGKLDVETPKLTDFRELPALLARMGF